MAKLVWDHRVDACVLGGSVQLGTKGVGRDAPALVGEEELDEASCPRVTERSPR